MVRRWGVAPSWRPNSHVTGVMAKEVSGGWAASGHCWNGTRKKWPLARVRAWRSYQAAS